MKQQEIRLLACDEEVLNEADDILGDELAKLNRYSRYCFTPTEIGKSFGIEGRRHPLVGWSLATQQEVHASGTH